jgi:hypothetical protein
MVDRLKIRKHLFGFDESFEWNAIAQREELVPHCPEVGVFVCGLDGFLQFPFRHLDDGAIFRSHDRRGAISYQTFFPQSRNARPHKIEKLSLFSRLGPIRNDNADSSHLIYHSSPLNRW